MQNSETLNQTVESRIKSLIRDIPDFPKKGILFRDITPLLLDPALCDDVVDEFVNRMAGQQIDMVCAVESRGFFFGTLLANRLKIPFVPIRKAGKLPGDIISYTYDLEYGTSTIEIQDGVIKPGSRILLHDDLLATGGTILASMELIKKQKAEIAAVTFLVSLEFLEGPLKLKREKANVIALAKYS